MNDSDHIIDLIDHAVGAHSDGVPLEKTMTVRYSRPVTAAPIDDEEVRIWIRLYEDPADLLAAARFLRRESPREYAAGNYPLGVACEYPLEEWE